MRRFEAYRPNPPASYAELGLAAEPGRPSYEGVLWTDGSVTIRWRTSVRSTAHFDCLADLIKIHGHPDYGTVIRWLDPDPDGRRDCPAKERCADDHQAGCRKCSLGYHCGRHGDGCHQACARTGGIAVA